MKLMISEILKNASVIKSRNEKIKYLRENMNVPLLRVLDAAYHPDRKFQLPDDDPKYKPAHHAFGFEKFYYESRKLVYFIEGGSPNLNQRRREEMFIEFLENIHPDDALMMLKVKKKKMLFPTLTENLIRETFPDLLPEVQKQEEIKTTDVQK
tara:strand:- start:28356 stop:28814 length:459 start_codon:yes stop_codon:yes gene_type:complete